MCMFKLHQLLRIRYGIFKWGPISIATEIKWFGVLASHTDTHNISTFPVSPSFLLQPWAHRCRVLTTTDPLPSSLSHFPSFSPSPVILPLPSQTPEQALLLLLLLSRFSLSNSVRPHRRQPTRLPRPWDPPGKNTGVGCHFLLQCMKLKSESEVTQSCPTLSDAMDCSPPGSSVHGISRQECWSGVPLLSPRPSTETLSFY